MENTSDELHSKLMAVSGEIFDADRAEDSWFLRGVADCMFGREQCRDKHEHSKAYARGYKAAASYYLTLA